jgi:hypothetical protein
MNDTPCADCGVETLPTDHRRAEWYVVTDEVWPRTHGATVTAYTDQRQARSNPTPLHSGGAWRALASNLVWGWLA